MKRHEAHELAPPTRLTFLQLSSGWGLYLIIDILKKSIWTQNHYYILYFFLPGILLWMGFTFLLQVAFNWSVHFNIANRLGLLFITGLGVGVLKHLAAVQLFLWLGVDFSKPHIARLNAPFFFIEATLIAWIVLIIYFVIEFYQSYKFQTIRSAQLESKLAQAQLQALKMQLQPHFLFNTHNSIVTLMRSGMNEKAIKMLLGLSDLLRLSLTRSAEQMITLKEELELLKQYLAIESERFEEGLTVEFAVDDELKHAMVPNFILQPLIENAIKHGVGRTIGHSIIRISARTKNDLLEIEIYNTAPSLGEHWHLEQQDGIGLKNTQKRLQQLYAFSSCTLTDFEDGVILTLKIPYHLSDR